MPIRPNLPAPDNKPIPGARDATADFEDYIKTVYTEKVPAHQQREIKAAFMAGAIKGLMYSMSIPPDLDETNDMAIIEWFTEQFEIIGNQVEKSNPKHN